MFDADCPLVADLVERSDESLPVDVSESWKPVHVPVVPVDADVLEQVPFDLGVLRMYMENPVPEFSDGFDVVNSLPDKM